MDDATWDGQLACKLPDNVLGQIMANAGLDSPPCKAWREAYSAMLATRGLCATWLTVRDGADQALCRAAGAGRTVAVVALLDGGIRADVFHHRPLKLAATNGHADVAHVLLDRGSDLHADGERPLNLAVEKNRVQVVELFLHRGADLHEFNDRPLRWAAKEGHLEVVRLLVAHGGNVNAGRDINDNVHHYSVGNQGTPLLSAISSGHLDVVRLLVEHGANVQDSNDSKWAPLCLAVDHGFTEIARLLLNKGADVHAGGERALFGALDTEIGDTNNEIVRRLLDHGANINFLPFCPCDAVRQNNVGLLRVLLQWGQLHDEVLRRARDAAIALDRWEMIDLLSRAMV